MRIHHSEPYDPAGLVNHTHRRPLETNVQSCKHPHRCSPSFARGITSGKGRLPAGEQQPHVWDVLMSPDPSATLADFSRARDSQITFSVTHGWSAFWRGRPWFAERRIGETSLAVGSSRFWIGWVT